LPAGRPRAGPNPGNCEALPNKRERRR
jgi:hypothetical protein